MSRPINPTVALEKISMGDCRPWEKYEYLTKAEMASLALRVLEEYGEDLHRIYVDRSYREANRASVGAFSGVLET